MTIGRERPAARDTALHLFRRPLHPEFFDVLASRRVGRDDFSLSVAITPQGHFYTWIQGDLVLSEVIATRQQELPSRGRVWRHRFDGGHADAFRAAPHWIHRMSSQIEILDERTFTIVHEDISHDGQTRGLFYRFDEIDPFDRVGLPALGLVVADSRRECLSIQTFHTYPSDLMVLKTQTIIERV
jgi:hypothetical protein